MQKKFGSVAKGSAAATGLAYERKVEVTEMAGLKQLIVHIEDENEWIQVVSEALENSVYSVKSFTDLTIAESFIQTNKEKIQLVICDGTIKEKFDGILLAKKMFDSGYKTLILSSAVLPNRFVKGIPVVDKLNFYSAEFPNLVNKTIEVRSQRSSIL